MELRRQAADFIMEMATHWWVLPMLEVHRLRKPCSYFLKLPEETQEMLRELKSDDLKNIRWENWTPCL